MAEEDIKTPLLENQQTKSDDQNDEDHHHDGNDSARDYIPPPPSQTVLGLHRLLPTSPPPPPLWYRKQPPQTTSPPPPLVVRRPTLPVLGPPHVILASFAHRYFKVHHPDLLQQPSRAVDVTINIPSDHDIEGSMSSTALSITPYDRGGMRSALINQPPADVILNIQTEQERKILRNFQHQSERTIPGRASSDHIAEEIQEAERLKKREDERKGRIKELSEGLRPAYSRNFDTNISEKHQEKMKELVDERSKLDDKASTLCNKCYGTVTSLFTYISGTITFYGVVNVAETLAGDISLWRTLTLASFIYLLQYFKESALAQLHCMKEDEMRLIQNRRLELIRNMNQLRCSIDLAASEKTDEVKMLEDRQLNIPEHMKAAQRIDEQAAGDNFHTDCEKILATIPDSYFEHINQKVKAIFLSGVLVLVILGLSFLVRLFLFWLIPTFGPAPPSIPPPPGSGP